MQIMITISDNHYRISNISSTDEIDTADFPKEILYEIYDKTKKLIEEKGKENE
jgi:hypothetical protein